MNAYLALQSAVDTGVRESFRLLDLPAAWVLVLVIVPLAVGVAWLGYRGEPLSGATRALLTSLRLSALLILLFVLFRPVMVQHREEVQQAEVLVLLDDSASMRRMDTYSNDRELREALKDLSEKAPGKTMRAELAEAIVERELQPLFAERDYRARVFRFADTLVPHAADSSLDGRGSATHIGDALSQVIAAHRGRHVTDLVLLSDGKSNGGNSPSEAARSAALAGVPVHTVVIGDTRPEKNALLELVEAPTSALEGDEIAVIVRVRGRGAVDGTLTTQVLLEELSEQGDVLDARILSERETALSETGERITMVAPPGPADPRTGDRRFRVSVPPLEGETLLDDNALEFSVHVTPEKVRVLYVDGYPRWEYRYLKNLLLRADKNLEVQCFLLSATPDFPQESTKELQPLRTVPTDRRELLDNYDVIILGDVSPYAVSPDPEEVDEFFENVKEFVQRGGGLLLIAGEYDNPRTFIDSPLEELFPVLLDAAEMQSYRGDTTREFRPKLEDPHNAHEIVRLHPDPDINRELWEDEGGLRGQYWFAPVTRAKPGSQVLLRHPSASPAQESANYPLLVSGYFPSGRTLFVAFDSTWMWRFHFGDTYHERFWRNAIRWLSLGRLRSGDRRFRIEAARNNYSIGERVSLEARVLDEDYRPSEASTQEVRWSDPDGKSYDLVLPAVPGRPGLYRGALEASQPGLHRVWIEADGKRLTSTEFDVVLPSLENRDPAPDPALMAEIALLSRGRSVDLSQLDQLEREFPGGEERREPISSRLDDVWDTWGTLLIALGVLSLEWVLRKRLELV